MDRRKFLLGLALLPAAPIVWPSAVQAQIVQAVGVASTLFGIFGQFGRKDTSSEALLLVLDSLRQISEQNVQIFKELVEIDRHVAAIPNEVRRLEVIDQIEGLSQLFAARIVETQVARRNGTPLSYNEHLVRIAEINTQAEKLIAEMDGVYKEAPDASQLSLLYAILLLHTLYLKSSYLITFGHKYSDALKADGVADDEKASEKIAPPYSPTARYIGALTTSAGAIEAIVGQAGWLTALTARNYPGAFDSALTDEDRERYTPGARGVGMSGETFDEIAGDPEGDDALVAQFDFDVLFADHTWCKECDYEDNSERRSGLRCWQPEADELSYGIYRKSLRLYADASVDAIPVVATDTGTVPYYDPQDVDNLQHDLNFQERQNAVLVVADYNRCGPDPLPPLSERAAVLDQIENASAPLAKTMQDAKAQASVWWRYLLFYYPFVRGREQLLQEIYDTEHPESASGT